MRWRSLTSRAPGWHVSWMLGFAWSWALVDALEGDHPHDLVLQMPGAHPTKPDQYLCYAKKFPGQRSYIIGYKPQASQRVTHHMIVMSCYYPQTTKTYWLCGGMGSMCAQGPSRTLYAWGRDAPGMTFPPGVGIEVGNETSARYAVIQLHYTDMENIPSGGDHTGVVIHMTAQRPPYLAFIYLMLSYNAHIPPGNDKIYNVDVQCSYRGETVMHPFAFRTHAHKHAVQITAYVVHNGKYLLIGTQTPQRPQAFYPVANKTLVVHHGDILAARCSYNTSGEKHSLRMGATRHDEMCNFYIMYYVKADNIDRRGQEFCGNAGQAAVFDDFPHPTLPLLITPSTQPGQHQNSQMKTFQLDSHPTPHALQPHLPSSLTQRHFSSLFSTSLSQVPTLKVAQWPAGSESGQLDGVELGQVGGLVMDEHRGRLLVFHRGSHIWGAGTFSGHWYNEMDLGPIATPTVLEIDEKTGRVITSWGAGMFYLPHGIAVDKNGYVWLTDVAMHQVLKFRPSASAPILTLGIRFQPGSDTQHFCQPAAVAVDKWGHVYVADGYCNHRIMKFTSHGHFLAQWGAGGTHHHGRSVTSFRIPHSLALLDEHRLLCVADREHGRVLCYNSSTGQLVFHDTPSSFGGRVFAIGFSKVPRGYLYAVSGASRQSKPLGFTLRQSQEGLSVEKIWVPAAGAFSQPHALCTSSSGAVYVGEIGPNRLWKFVSEAVEVSKQSQAVITTAEPLSPAVHHLIATAALPSVHPASTPVSHHFPSSAMASSTSSNISTVTVPSPSLLNNRAMLAVLILSSMFFGALLGGLVVKHVNLRRQRRHGKIVRYPLNGGPHGNFTELNTHGSDSDEF